MKEIQQVLKQLQVPEEKRTAITSVGETLPATRSQTQLTTYKTGAVLISKVLNSPPLDLEDKKLFAAVLSANFGINYADKSSLDYEKMNLVFNHANFLGMRQEEFHLQVKKFLMETPYATWTMADFFKTVKPGKLYPYSWAEKERANGAKWEDFEAYEVAPGEKPRWRYAADERLPLVMVYPVDERKPHEGVKMLGTGKTTDSAEKSLDGTLTREPAATRKLRESLDYANKAMLKAIAEKNELIDKIEGLESVVNRQYANEAKLHEAIEGLNKEISELKQQLFAVLEGKKDDE